MAKRNTQSRIRFHISRMLLSGLLIVSVLLARSNTAAFTLVSHTNDVKGSVLAYATGMSINDLLTSANASRSANGLPVLRLNSQLNSSAQAKAAHMITNNYWAHTAPDGTEPWYFFNQAGYVYTRAGENLAYGFNTGSEVNTGWMNSPTHRDNILGDYAEIGFGIANGATYQGGENTVVVAHYGKPLSAAPTPAPTTPASTTPPTTPAPSPAPVASNKPAPTPATPAPADTSTSTQTDSADTPKDSTNQEKSSETKVKTGGGVTSPNQPKNVSLLEQLQSGHAPSVAYASLGIVTLSTAGYAITHRLRIKHLIEKGKKIKLQHPMFDIMIIGSALAMILGSTVGRLL